MNLIERAEKIVLKQKEERIKILNLICEYVVSIFEANDNISDITICEENKELLFKDLNSVKVIKMENWQLVYDMYVKNAEEGECLWEMLGCVIKGATSFDYKVVFDEGEYPKPIGVNISIGKLIRKM